MKRLSVLLTHPYRARLFAESSKVRLIAPNIGLVEPEDSASVSQFLCIKDGDRLGTIRSFLADHDVDIVVCSSPRDDMAHEDSSLVAELSGTRTRCIGMDAESSEVFFDKLCTNRFLEAIGSLIPPNVDISTALLPVPIIAKPRKSWGGKGIVKIESKQDFEAHRSENHASYVYQAYLTGIEISVVLVSDGADYLLSPIVFKGGVRKSYRHALKRLRITPFEPSENVKNDLGRLAANVTKLVTNPCCLEIEGIIHEDHLYVTEINGRLTGVTHLLATVGFNVPDKLLQFAEVDRTPLSEFEVTGIAAEIPFNGQLSKDDKTSISNSSYHQRFFERVDALGHRIRALAKVGDSTELVEMVSSLGNLDLLATGVEKDFELFTENGPKDLSATGLH